MSTRPDFQEFTKIYRLRRPVIITEKIDGTNASVWVPEDDTEPLCAGSRNRWITPEADNMGFARWVKANEAELRKLGPGLHYGEWMGLGIQRGYGLKEKRFYLFNVGRWNEENRPACCHIVPKLAEFPTLDIALIETMLEALQIGGSRAAPGFMKPEGIVVFHEQSGYMFKVTLDGDGHKGAK